MWAASDPSGGIQGRGLEPGQEEEVDRSKQEDGWRFTQPCPVLSC